MSRLSLTASAMVPATGRLRANASITVTFDEGCHPEDVVTAIEDAAIRLSRQVRYGHAGPEE